MNVRADAAFASVEPACLSGVSRVRFSHGGYHVCWELDACLVGLILLPVCGCRDTVIVCEYRARDHTMSVAS